MQAAAESACPLCTTQVLLQNMALALGSIAALALPVLAGWLPLWIAVTLHEGSTLLVALNSLRLLHWPANPLVRSGTGAEAESDVQRPLQQPGEQQQPDLAAQAA